MLEIGAQAHHLLGAGATGGEQADDALPHRVVVAERPVQLDGLLHQRIEVDRHQVGRPADLHDRAVGLAHLQRGIERTARAGGIAHDIGAQRIERAHDFLERLVVDVDDVRRAQFARDLEASAVGSATRDHERIGAAERGHLRAEQADRSGTEHDHEVTRLDVGIDAHRLVRDAVRLGQARDVERQRVGNVMQAARRHAHVLRHRAVDAVAEALARRAQVVATGAAHQALAADVGGGLADDAIAFLEAPSRRRRPGRRRHRTRARASPAR